MKTPIPDDASALVERAVAMQQAATDATDYDSAFDVLRPLVEERPGTALAAARMLCASRDPNRRALGADMLGAVNVPDRRYVDEALAVLAPMLERERDTDVLWSSAIALGELGDVRAIELLARMRTGRQAPVRYWVARGLSSCLERDADARGVAALAELCDDEHEAVRAAALAGLARARADMPDLRDALAHHLPADDAVFGLAVRDDERALEPLRRGLEGGEPSGTLLAAAFDLADTTLLDVVDETIADRCDPAERASFAARERQVAAEVQDALGLAVPVELRGAFPRTRLVVLAEGGPVEFDVWRRYWSMVEMLPDTDAARFVRDALAER